MGVSVVQVEWTGQGAVGGGLSSFLFNSAVGTPTQMGSAVSTFLAATEDRRCDQLSWVRVPIVNTYNEVTLALESTAGLVASSGVGTDIAQCLSPATQGLLQLRTGLITFGRLLRGRLFLPGPTEQANNDGKPDAAYIADYDAAAAALAGDANTDLVVWSRTHGVKSVVTSALTWNQWAVLRSRRD